MNFTPHSRLTLGAGACTHNAADTNSDGGVFKTDTDKSLDEHHPFPVLLMPRSLLIFKDNAYSGWYRFLELTALFLVIVLLFSNRKSEQALLLISRLLACYKRQ